jgi:hypothetical protein
MERGWTRGVRDSIRARIWRAAAVYLLKSGRMTTASGLQRLEHGHGGADAIDAGDVAGGGDDAANAAADDDGAGEEFRAVALFHAGVEGIAIDVGDGEGGEFRVADDAAVGAGGADGGVAGIGAAIAAEGGGAGGEGGRHWDGCTGGGGRGVKRVVILKTEQ